MGKKYVHDPAPSEEAKRFIRWCAENITEWQDPYVSVARFLYAGKNSKKWWNKNFTWREHHSGLSHSWAVCTKSQWEAAREALNG